MFIIFINIKINVIKFDVLDFDVCKLQMIYNNVKNKFVINELNMQIFK